MVSFDCLSGLKDSHFLDRIGSDLVYLNVYAYNINTILILEKKEFNFFPNKYDFEYEIIDVAKQTPAMLRDSQVVQLSCNFWIGATNRVTFLGWVEFLRSTCLISEFGITANSWFELYCGLSWGFFFSRKGRRTQKTGYYKRVLKKWVPKIILTYY